MPKLISFIICVNDETYFEECLFYIDRLRLPEGYMAEVWPVRQAASIYQGYNLAMQQSEAEYKVYMHQDVFLVAPDILLKFLELFENHPRAGMAGVLGADRLSADRRFYRSWNQGHVIGCSEKKAFRNHLSEGAAQAAALDGMFLMTRRDIPWREDALSGWDFYDISQSLEFSRKGHELWALAGKQPWCVHDCGYLNLTGYDRAQEAFLEIYQSGLPDYAGQDFVYPEPYRQRFARATMEQVWDERFLDTEAVILKNILEILQAEREDGVLGDKSFLFDCGSFEQAQRKYMEVKFYLRRKKYAPDAATRPDVSAAAERIIRRHTML